MRLGTCSEAIAEQESCELDPANYVGSGINQARVSPRACSVTGAILPNTNTEVNILPICTSYYNDNITSGFEDELQIFVETGGSDRDSCRGENTPVLTSQDWIEPIPGQRYMCYQFLDPNDATKTYSALFMSLGNEPCDGPKPEDSGGDSGGYTSKLSGLGLLVALLIAVFI